MTKPDTQAPAPHVTGREEEILRLKQRIADLTTERDNLANIVASGIDEVAGAALDDAEETIQRLSKNPAPTALMPVPEGWRLVPVEPTAQMAFAGINAVTAGQKYDKPTDPQFAADLATCSGDKGAVRAIQNYRAMLAAAPAPAPDVMGAALADALAERRRQVEGEGWIHQHDDQYRNGELTRAAMCYLLGNPGNWPWTRNWWKPTDRRRDLIKAAALIIAEIERIDRATAAEMLGQKTRGMTDDDVH